jgi:hypothetical protein
MAKIRRHGAIPLFSWSSGASGGDPKHFQLRDLRAGRYDGHIRGFARAARDWGHPFFLRFDWEMNGGWFSWGADANGNEPGEFVAAWRHVHRIFDRVGADNATWVWCPYARDEPLRPFYPGDGYVDWTCLDGYNVARTRASRRRGAASPRSSPPPTGGSPRTSLRASR